RESDLRPGHHSFRTGPFHLCQTDRCAGAWLAAGACGLGLFHRRCLHRRGLGDTHPRGRTAGGRAVRRSDGHVFAACVGTRRGGRLYKRLPMERGRRLVGADGCRLGSGGFLPRHPLARRGQALAAALRQRAGAAAPQVCRAGYRLVAKSPRPLRLIMRNAGARVGVGPFFPIRPARKSATVADMRLDGRVAVVTGATKGVGKGIARELAQHGARVFVTGRSAPESALPGEQTTRIRCDHRPDAQVEAVFTGIVRETNAIDILVNSVWGGYERMVEHGDFTWPKPFWEQPLWRWDAMFIAGVRAHYQASQLAAPTMIAQRRGLIVNISFWAAQKHVGNVAYGVSQAATDKMTADMAIELKAPRVAVVSLYPGLVRTEKVMEAAQYLDLSNSESPEFIGRAVAALAADTDVLRYTGQVLVAAKLAKEYGFKDIDGKVPEP